MEYRLRSGLEPPTFASNSVLGNFGGLVRSLPDILDELDINKSKEEQERSSNGELLDSETQITRPPSDHLQLSERIMYVASA